MPMANTVQTYTNAALIREDLEQQYNMISPMETPFQTAIGVGSPAKQTYTEWSIVDLRDPDASNRVVEGDAEVPNDVATLGVRLGNYTQISDKVVATSHTSEVVDAAAENIQRMAKQMAIKIKEMKRDVEVMLLSNVVANPGASGTARVAAGLPCWLRTNIVLGATGTAPAMSGAPGNPKSGYPDTALDPGTPAALTENELNTVIESCWNQGAEPSIILVNSGNKRTISQTFTGNATRYKDVIDKRLVNAVDVYDSDFGELSVVPTRFLPVAATDAHSVYVLDPNYAEIKYLEPPKQKPLAKTGHAERRLLWMEYTLKVHNEAAHGAIHGTTGVYVP